MIMIMIKYKIGTLSFLFLKTIHTAVVEKTRIRCGNGKEMKTSTEVIGYEIMGIVCNS